MKRVLCFSLTTIVLCLALPLAALAACAPLPELQSALSERYGEQTVWVGIQKNGQHLVILAEPGGGTFTILRLRPDGTACSLIDGSSWAALEPTHPIPGEDG